MIYFMAGLAAGAVAAGRLVYLLCKRNETEAKINGVENKDFQRRQFANLMYYNVGEKGVNELEN